MVVRFIPILLALKLGRQFTSAVMVWIDGWIDEWLMYGIYLPLG